MPLSAQTFVAPCSLIQHHLYIMLLEDQTAPDMMLGVIFKSIFFFSLAPALCFLLKIFILFCYYYCYYYYSHRLDWIQTWWGQVYVASAALGRPPLCALHVKTGFNSVEHESKLRDRVDKVVQGLEAWWEMSRRTEHKPKFGLLNN